MRDPLDSLPETVFPVELAARAGLRTSRHRRHDLVIPARGVRQRVGTPVVGAEHAVAHARRDAGLVVSYLSAAEVWGLWLPRRLAGSPLADLARVAHGAKPRIRGVRGRRLDVPAEHVVVLDRGRAPWAVTSPAWTWMDLAVTGLTLEEMVVAGDALLRRPGSPRRGTVRRGADPLATPARIASLLSARAGRRGMRLVREAVTRLRAGSDSPMESLLRLRMVDSGLPEPEVNPEVVVLRDPVGRTLRAHRVDLFYRRARLAIQYEGEHHFTDAAQRRRDMRRDEELRGADVEVVRVDSDVFRPGSWARFTARVEGLLAPRGSASTAIGRD